MTQISEYIIFIAIACFLAIFLYSQYQAKQNIELQKELERSAE